MKICYIVNIRLPSEKAHGYQVIKMCEALAEMGAQVRLIHPRRRQPVPMAAREPSEFYGVSTPFTVTATPNIDVVRLERMLPGPVFRALFFLHALLWGAYAVRGARRDGADLYYTRETPIALWLVWYGLPTVLELHVVPLRASRWLLRALARRSSLRLVVALTSFIAQRVAALGIDPGRLMVLPDAVEPKLFAALPSQAACRRRVGLPGDCQIVGYVGGFRTLGMEKGIPELIHAVGQLHRRMTRPPMLLCVGGPLDGLPRYRALARAQGLPDEAVRIMDRVPTAEVPYWMRACDVATIPWPWTEFSAYFTSPLKLFEYMAAGVPIVASDLPALRDVLTHERTALLVPPGDPRALADALQRLLEDRALSRQLVSSAEEAVRAHTWQHRAERLLRRFQDQALGPQLSAGGA